MFDAMIADDDTAIIVLTGWAQVSIGIWPIQRVNRARFLIWFQWRCAACVIDDLVFDAQGSGHQQLWTQVFDAVVAAEQRHAIRTTVQKFVKLARCDDDCHHAGRQRISAIHDRRLPSRPPPVFQKAWSSYQVTRQRTGE